MVRAHDIDTLCYILDSCKSYSSAAAFMLRGHARCSVDLPLTDCTGKRPKMFVGYFNSAGGEDHHWPLAFASQFGHVQIVRILFDVDGDPTRTTQSVP
jgi:hypothetical protein